MRSPFKFLDAYSKEDKEIFFGRHAEVETLYEMAFETNLILLYGASGTGKTSLINCGLSNKFQDTDWFSMFIRRGNHIVHSLDREIRQHATTEIPEGVPITKALRSLFYDHYKPIYLIFDQFEELFIMGDHEEQMELFTLISELMGMSLQVTIILSMREEYIAYLSDFEPVVPALFQHRFRVEKMNRVNLEEVITQTARAFEIEIVEEAETVDRMLANLHNKRTGVDLTNLQVYLDRLYRSDVQRMGNEERPIRFDPELLDRVGELEDVLSDFLEEQLSVVEGELGKKGVPLDVLFALVTDDGTKRARNPEEIKESLQRRKNIAPKDVEFCIERFSDMRIFRELEE